MAWNPQQQYPYHQMHQQEWNPYAANGMWNMMSMFPGLLPGANLNHTGLMYPINGSSSVPHLGTYPTPGLNKRASEHPLRVPQAEVSPPLSPHDVEDHPYEPPQLPEPSLPLTSFSPPHSPPLDLNDTKYPIPTGLLNDIKYPTPPGLLNDTKYPTPTGLFPTHPHANPFLQPSLGTTPFPLSRGFPFPQTVQEPHEGQVAPLAAAAALLNSQMAEVPTRDTNGRKLPRWMIKRSVCQVCNKRFESRHKLQLHMYSHTGERPHQCEVCGMRFARKFCYKRHLKTHTLDKPHTCTRCGRGFREKYDMETHLMTEVCLRSTTTEGQSTTAGEQTFTCKECKASFPLEQELEAHSKVHKEPCFTACPICKAGFSRPEHLKQHLHEQHPGYRDNHEHKSEQQDPQELQFNFREQIAAFKGHQDIVYPDHQPILYHSTESSRDPES
ncbi:unnamed protein product, partial [Meganyctiphanes norvegica]